VNILGDGDSPVNIWSNSTVYDYRIINDEHSRKEQMHLATKYAASIFIEAVRAHSAQTQNSTANIQIGVRLSEPAYYDEGSE
jgi:hypothetical protein